MKSRRTPLAALLLAPLAALAETAPEAAFSFDLPAGPQFSEAQKTAQRAAAQRVVPLVQEAYSNGAASVRIPPGDYRFGKERWDRDGVVYALEFSGLARDAEHAFTIDATGATLWFDLPDDQAPNSMRVVAVRLATLTVQVLSSTPFRYDLSVVLPSRTIATWYQVSTESTVPFGLPNPSVPPLTAYSVSRLPRLTEMYSSSPLAE